VVERGELAFECRNCWHLSQVDTLALVGRFGPRYSSRESSSANGVPAVRVAPGALTGSVEGGARWSCVGASATEGRAMKSYRFVRRCVRGHCEVIIASSLPRHARLLGIPGWPLLQWSVTDFLNEDLENQREFVVGHERRIRYGDTVVQIFLAR
jgi:hypothetical protein